VNAAPDDAQGFASWVGPHLTVLNAVAGRLVSPAADADDVVQEALIRAWRRRSTFDADRGTARAWLLAILVDRARRHRVRGRVVELSCGVDDADSFARPDSIDLGTDPGRGIEVMRLDVERAVVSLPRRQREVITLHYLADLPVADVAVVLGISVGSVKSHLFDARAALRSRLEES